MTTINIDALKDAIRQNLSYKSGDDRILATLLTIWGDRNLAMDAGRTLENYKHYSAKADRIAAEIGYDYIENFALPYDQMPAALGDAFKETEVSLESFFAVSRRVMIAIGDATEADYADR